MLREATRRTVRTVSASLALALAACGSTEREFPGYTKDQVWKAMVETAEDPRYPDWIVVSNEVFRDDAGATVEIRRDLRRDLVVVGQKPRREQCEWKFTATVQSTEPPTLSFRTDTVSIPAHWWMQEQQFLNEVERRLAGVALPPPRSGGAIARPPVPADAPAAAGAEGTQVKAAGSEPAVPGDIPESDHAVRARSTAPKPPTAAPPKSSQPAPPAEPAAPPAEPPAPHEPAPADPAC